MCVVCICVWRVWIYVKRCVGCMWLWSGVCGVCVWWMRGVCVCVCVPFALISVLFSSVDSWPCLAEVLVFRGISPVPLKHLLESGAGELLLHFGTPQLHGYQALNYSSASLLSS